MLQTRWRLFQSLHQHDFRLYFFSQCASQHGAWMQRLAQAWLVYRLTASGFMLGLVAFAGTLPILVFGLWGGTMADRVSRRRLFLATQLLAMTQALLLAGLAWSSRLQSWHILILALILGGIQAIEIPARQAFVAHLVPRDVLPNAIALNSMTIHVSRFVGPAVAGGLVRVVGEEGIFAINAASFLATVLAVWAIPAGDVRQRASTTPLFGEGLRYVWQHRPMRAVLGLVALASLCSTSYVVLMPVFAREVFGGQAETLGLLLAAAGLGALAGALYLAHRGREAGLDKLMGWVGMGTGVGLVIFALSREIGAALLVLPLIGFCIATLVAGGNTYMQLQAPDALRGRLLALFSVVFIGHTALGNLAAGILSHRIGVAATVLAFGAICMVGSMVFIWTGDKARGPDATL